LEEMVRGERSGHARKCKKDGTTNGRHPLAEKFAHKRPKFGLPAQVKDERVHAVLVLVALGRLLRPHDDCGLPLDLNLFGDDNGRDVGAPELRRFGRLCLAVARVASVVL
jgi:hypothetical protein